MVSAMAEHWFTFNEDANIRAILAGTKTQTRRLVKEAEPDPGHSWRECLCREIDPSDTPCVVCDARFPGCHYEVGEVVWVKENFAWADEMHEGHELDDPVAVAYRADESAIWWEPGAVRRLDTKGWNWEHRSIRWRRPMYMPRWCARIFLEITAIRVERLQDISLDDARAEGIPQMYGEARALGYGHVVEPSVADETGATGPDARDIWDNSTSVENFARLWDHVNGARARWNANPWVRVYSFKLARVEPAGKAAA